MTFWRHLFGSCLLALGALFLGSCGTDGNGNGCLPTDPTCNGPMSGRLVLEIATPHSDDRAIVLTIHGDFIAAQANTGYRLFPSADGRTFVVVSVGNMAPSSRVLTIDVPDVAKRTGYSVTITEVAASDYSLRSDLSAYQMSFVEVSN